MSKRENIKTTSKQIVEYWSEKVSDWELTVKWCNAHKCCWRCGRETSLQRAHIVPDSLGGKDEPSNFVLLCEKCHSEAPNVVDPEIMWDWLKAYNTHSVALFGTLLAYREYKFIYKTNFLDDFEYIENKANITSEEYTNLKKQMFSIGEGACKHFGQVYLNTATFAGVMRMFLKDLASNHGVEFPINDTDEDELLSGFIECF